MSDRVFCLNLLLALLKRAERGETLDESDYNLVHHEEFLNGQSADPELQRATHFLQHYVTDEEDMKRDHNYREGRMGVASKHAAAVEAIQRKSL